MLQMRIKDFNFSVLPYLSLNPLTWKIWWAPNNASRCQMRFNSAFKGLNERRHFKYFAEMQINLLACVKIPSAFLGSIYVVNFCVPQEGRTLSRSVRTDSHYASRFRSVTVPSPFRQNGLCSHCPSCSVTFQNSPWQEACDYFHQICSPLPQNAFSIIC